MSVRLCTTKPLDVAKPPPSFGFDALFVIDGAFGLYHLEGNPVAPQFEPPPLCFLDFFTLFDFFTFLDFLDTLIPSNLP